MESRNIMQPLLAVFYEHQDIYLRLFVAFLFGLFIGYERARKGKAAGIRTHVLVCLGSCLIMVLSLMNSGANQDPMRLAAQVISGIGFIGAGVIWKDMNNVKHGLTTAANIWITSAIGLVIGYGKFDVAFVTVVLMFLAFQLPDLAEKIRLLPKHSPQEGDSDGE